MLTFPPVLRWSNSSPNTSISTISSVFLSKTVLPRLNFGAKPCKLSLFYDRPFISLSVEQGTVQGNPGQFLLSASAAHAVCSHLRSGKISCLQVCLLGLQVFSSPWQSVDFVNILSFAFGETAEFAGFWAAHCPFSFRENPADFRARKPQGSVFALGNGISQGKNPSVPAVHEVTLPVFQTVKTRRRGRLWRERVSSPRTQLVKKVFLTSLQTGKQVPCRYHLLQFLLRGMGFSGAKIAPSPPYTRRFCRFSKPSKSVGFRRLENLKGFRPAPRGRL